MKLLKKSKFNYILFVVLLFANTYVFANGINSVIKSINAGGLNALEVFLAKGGEVDAKDSDGNSLLFHAIVAKNKGAVKKLIVQGANPNVRNKYGAPILITATGSGFVEIVKLLLDKGADVNSKFGRYDNISALMLAAQDGYEELLDVLIKRGADVNSETDNGDTALIAAVAKGNLRIIKKLVKNGAKIDVRSESGYSALFIAISEGDEKIVKFLIENGASTTLTDDNGDSAFTFAERLKNPNIINALKEAKQ